MSDRLPWERNPTGGFVAWPEGREQPKRLATVQPFMQNGTWSWRVGYDIATSSGHAPTSQLAADAATSAWPKVRAASEALAKRAAAEVAFRAGVEQAADEPDPDVSIFASEAATYENMMAAMTQLRGQTRPGALKIMAALSAEFFRRRRR